MAEQKLHVQRQEDKDFFLKGAHEWAEKVKMLERKIQRLRSADTHQKTKLSANVLVAAAGGSGQRWAALQTEAST